MNHLSLDLIEEDDVRDDINETADEQKRNYSYCCLNHQKHFLKIYGENSASGRDSFFIADYLAD